MSVVRITPEGVGEGNEPWQGVYNPAFDVTPAELISEEPVDLSVPLGPLVMSSSQSV